MHSIILAAAALATISHATPLASPAQNLETRAAGPQLATFDDLPNQSAIPVPYKGLNYTTLTVSDDSDGALGAAQSNPNFAILSSQQFPYVTIQGTPTTSFNLDSFYFSCFDSRSLVATGCEFTVTGINGPTSRNRYGPVKYSYSPAQYGGGAPMMKVDTTGWNGLLYFYINVLGDEQKKMRTWAAIDNVQYTTVE